MRGTMRLRGNVQSTNVDDDAENLQNIINEIFGRTKTALFALLSASIVSLRRSTISCLLNVPFG